MASATPRKFPSANWSVPPTLSAMDLATSSCLAASFVAEFCGVEDCPTTERAMPDRIRRAATRETLILASVIQKIYVSHGGKSNESGIPNFRGVGGLWRNYRIEEVASPDAYP